MPINWGWGTPGSRRVPGVKRTPTRSLNEFAEEVGEHPFALAAYLGQTPAEKQPPLRLLTGRRRHYEHAALRAWWAWIKTTYKDKK